ncbi:glutathione transferase GST 23-like [Momordica charantia]|uniref:Glutathione S-transferase n=1 Tax=Momordica charantia TaxID=3673 RepID=A0A6J1DVV9_MOMCH|nr:glutathione transferase GST 23-like [Momordica charantia]
MDDEVKLHGHWSSPFVYRVIWALSLKAIPYQYVEEDLANKSPLLLHYNPVHKQVPVLVHRGKPISESTVILEYIDETWPQNPLLPVDPLQRATVRFWIRLADDKGPVVWRMFCSGGEEHEKAKNESLEMLRNVEERCIGEENLLGLGGDKIGMLDLVYGVFGEWLEVMEQVMGHKLMEPHSFPRLHAWTRAFMEAPVIRDNRPDRERMVVAFKALRELLMKPTSSE